MKKIKKLRNSREKYEKRHGFLYTSCNKRYDAMVERTRWLEKRNPRAYMITTLDDHLQYVIKQRRDHRAIMRYVLPKDTLVTKRVKLNKHQWIDLERYVRRPRFYDRKRLFKQL